MPESNTAGQFIAAVFERWRRERIEFLVLRNYEGLPDRTTNDIDVLVARRQRRAAERLMLSVAHQQGFVMHNRAEFSTLAFYFHHPSTLAQVHFDLFTDLQWRNLRFLECDEFLGRRIERNGFFVPHPADEAATNLLAYTIYSGRVKDKYKEQVSTVARGEAHAMQQLLARSYGSRHAWALVQAAAREDWPAVEKRVPALRRRLFFRHINRRPAWMLWSGARNAFRLLRRFWRPPGLVVAFCGPDGCGKTTVRERLADLLAPSFSPSKSAHYHWKPPLLSTGRRARRVAASEPQAQPMRGRAVSVAYFAFHWLEFFIGAHLAFRWVPFRGGMVVIDRYYYDFFVDQKRYRLDVPSWLVQAGMVPLKEPDIVVLFDAPAEVLHARKQELSLAELRRQRLAFMETMKRIPSVVVVDATQPVDAVCQALARTILTYAADRRRR